MWDIPTIYSPQDFSPKEENFGQLRKPGESPCRQKSLCHGKLSSRMCFWGCGKRKQNAAHSEKFICLTGQLQIHPSPAWHQWKKKNRIGGLGCYFNSEQKLGLRSATLWIQSIPELLFPRVQQGWSSRGWALCSLLQPIFSWILPDSASPVLWIGTAKANPFLSTHGMNSSAPNPRFSPWGAAPCCFNGLKQSLELELISSKPWSFPSLEFFQPLKWFSLPSRLHGLCPSWDVEINLFSKFAF